MDFNVVVFYYSMQHHYLAEHIFHEFVQSIQWEVNKCLACSCLAGRQPIRLLSTYRPLNAALKICWAYSISDFSLP